MSNLYHRGDNIFLYVKFVDEKNKPINVENPMVKIIHSKNEEIIVDLDWFDLTLIGENEYFANYIIEHNADYSLYEIIYVGDYDNKTARVVESFTVIPNSEIYENVIKIYGKVNQQRTGYPLIGTSILASTIDESEIISSTSTNIEGYWECYVYPGEYKFKFSKFGFIEQEIIVQIGLEHNEMQFDNVALESEINSISGNGMYTISDKYITREGMSIVGLSVDAYNFFDLTTSIAHATTNEQGEWILFLDPGTYLLKTQGNLFDDNFEQTFRLRVFENGKFVFENLTSNIAIPSDENSLTNGDGSIEVTDIIIDDKGNPIIDVQVNVFKKNNMKNIIAQDYTDATGKWVVFLNSGSYTLEFYHPEFNVITEDRVVK